MESGDSESKAKIRVARLKWMEEEAEKIKLAKAEVVSQFESASTAISSSDQT